MSQTTKIKNAPKKTRRIPTTKPSSKTASEPVKAAAATLTDLLDELNQDAPRPIFVDVSDFLKWPDGETVTLQWRFPSVVDLYKVERTARAVAWEHKLPLELARDISMMAACHVAPETGGAKPSDFYAKIATRDHQRFWFWLVEQIALNFPELKPMPAEAQAVQATVQSKTETAELTNAAPKESETQDEATTAETGAGEAA